MQRETTLVVPTHGSTISIYQNGNENFSDAKTKQGNCSWFRDQTTCEEAKITTFSTNSNSLMRYLPRKRAAV